MSTSLRFDPDSPEFRVDPYPVYDRLREEAPFFHCSEWDMWVLTRYADCDAVLRDSRFGQGRDVLLDPPRDRRLVYEFLGNTMLGQDPPDHTRLRACVGRAFTQQRMTRLTRTLRGFAAPLLNRLRAAGRMDLVGDFASPLSLTAVSELLGLPAGDRALLRGWSGVIFATGDLTEDPQVYQRASAALSQFNAYMKEQAQQRRRRPREDFLSELVAMEADGKKLDETELAAAYVHLFSAGNETIVNFIGNAVLALFEHPGQLRKLREDPGLWKSAIEELLRYDCPIQMTSRFALEDVELAGGHPLRQGQQVGVVMGAANRDPRRFVNPDMLDLTRRPNPHMAFGSGIHYCLGATMSRLEGQVALEALLTRLPDLELATHELEYHEKFAQRGLKTLPVCWDAS